MAERLLDRLEDCKRTFPRVAVLGGAAGAVVSRLSGGRAGIESAVLLDSSSAMLERCRQQVKLKTIIPSVMHGREENRALCSRRFDEGATLFGYQLMDYGEPQLCRVSCAASRAPLNKFMAFVYAYVPAPGINSAGSIDQP